MRRKRSVSGSIRVGLTARVERKEVDDVFPDVHTPTGGVGAHTLVVGHRPHPSLVGVSVQCVSRLRSPVLRVRSGFVVGAVVGSSTRPYGNCTLGVAVGSSTRPHGNCTLDVTAGSSAPPFGNCTLGVTVESSARPLGNCTLSVDTGPLARSVQ